jgi:two-component system LytT family sensor kinase
VVETLSQLSSLIRLSFDDRCPQQLPLARELEFLDIYLAIQQLSFGERLVVRRHIAPGVMGALMVLQPLVENAIVHGVAKQPGAGAVHIEAAPLEDRLMLRIEDSGPGFTASGEPRARIDLKATQARLKLLYGTEYCIEFGPSRTGGASVTLLIPYVSSATESEDCCQPSKEYPVVITAAQA